jgi:hypothetical protein
MAVALRFEVRRERQQQGHGAGEVGVDDLPRVVEVRSLRAWSPSSRARSAPVEAAERAIARCTHRGAACAKSGEVGALVADDRTAECGDQHACSFCGSRPTRIQAVAARGAERRDFGGDGGRGAEDQGPSLHALAQSVTGSFVSLDAVVATANGDVVVGGNFASIDGVAAAAVARWNGSAWTALAGGFPGLVVTALLELPNGDLVASPGYAAGLRRWNGSSWSQLGATLDLAARDLALLPNGDLGRGRGMDLPRGPRCRHRRPVERRGLERGLA